MSKDQSTDNLYSELKHLADTLEELLSDSTEKSKEELDNLREKAYSTLQNARECLGKTTERFSKTTRAVVSKANDYISENPWYGMYIGVGCGLILGMLISRR